MCVWKVLDVNEAIPYWTLVPLYKRVIEVPVYVLELYAPRLIGENFKCLVNKYAVGASASGRTRAGFDGMLHLYRRSGGCCFR